MPMANYFYEPLEGSAPKALSFKMALLLVLTSAKRASERV